MLSHTGCKIFVGNEIFGVLAFFGRKAFGEDAHFYGNETVGFPARAVARHERKLHREIIFGKAAHQHQCIVDVDFLHTAKIAVRKGAGCYTKTEKSTAGLQWIYLTKLHLCH